MSAWGVYLDLKNKHILVTKQAAFYTNLHKCLNFIALHFPACYDLIPLCLFNIPPGIGAIQFQAD